MRFLLDSNILSEPTRKRPDPEVMRRLQRNIALCATAAPVIHELRFGIERLMPGKRQNRLRSYLDNLLRQNLPVLPYDLSAAQLHATAKTELAAQGVTLSHVDGQIAAIAQNEDLILVTRNERHFRIFPGLRVENWFDSEDA